MVAVTATANQMPTGSTTDQGRLVHHTINAANPQFRRKAVAAARGTCVAPNRKGTRKTSTKAARAAAAEATSAPEIRMSRSTADAGSLRAVTA